MPPPRGIEWRKRLLAFVVLAVTLAIGRGDVVNTEIKRKIDITTQLAKVTTQYTSAGVGKEYSFALPLDKQDHLAYLRVTIAGQPTNFWREAEWDGLAVYSAETGDVGENLNLKVYAVYTDVLVPHPAEITQMQDQSVLFTDSVLVPSPYKTLAQTTTVKLASNKIESKTEADPMTMKGDTVIYGPFQATEAFSSGPELRLHFVNHAPFAKITSCLREIEVSNWGNIAVEELYDMVHAGARLKGSFSRLDYGQYRQALQSNPSFRSLEATLPPLASDIYYRDNIGNVSTSAVMPTSKGLVLSILTRFPMFGGWKTAWYQGYNLPSQVGLRHDGSRFTLDMELGTPFRTVWVEDLTVKVILPEGATNVVASVPFQMEEARSTRFTYLDTPGRGRPVVTLHARNIVNEHNKKFQVYYDFSQASMLVEPLLLAAFFFAFFLITMVAIRLDMRIRVTDHSKKRI